MSKTYNLYIQKSNIQYPSSEEIKNAELAKKFAIGVYPFNKKNIPQGWNIINQTSKPNGFHGEAYEKDGKIIISFRGTEFYQPQDWVADSQMIRKKIPNQAKSALNFLL